MPSPRALDALTPAAVTRAGRPESPGALSCRPLVARPPRAASRRGRAAPMTPNTHEDTMALKLHTEITSTGKRLAVPQWDGGGIGQIGKLNAERAAELRDLLTAWLDAPRLAAREHAEIVAGANLDELDDIVKIALLRTPFEWGVGTIGVLGDPPTWFTGPTAEHDARALYASERGMALCVCGAECDEDEIDRSDDEPMCPKCVAAAREEWLALDVRCTGAASDPPCTWTGKGAEADDPHGEGPECPMCGANVDPVEEVATPSPADAGAR